MSPLVVGKTCSRCDKTKPLSDFSRQKLGKHGHRADCKTCQRAYNGAWKRANQERIRAVDRTYYEANREVVLAYNRAWNARNRESADEATRKWRSRNPAKVKAQKAAGRRRRRGLLAKMVGSDYTNATKVAARVEMYAGLCRYCAAPWQSIDHRIPVSRGGTHFPANLVPCCTSCNSRKKDKTESEFLALLAREGVTPYPHG